MEIIISALLFTLFVAGTIALVSIAFLKVIEVSKWFQERRNLLQEDQNKLAFSVMEKLNNGEYTTTVGIFDLQSESIVDAQQFQSEEVDESIKQMHQSGVAIHR